MLGLEQIFCKHIWKTHHNEELRHYIQYVGVTPIYEVKTYAAINYCIKCKKREVREQKQLRRLSAEEIQHIIENGVK